MRTFRDKAGREWSIALPYDTVLELKDKLGIDLLAIADDDGKLLAQLADDLPFLFRVMFVVLTEQIEAAGLDERQFARGFGGDVFELALEAFLEELADFFPPGKRRLLKAALAKLKTVRTKAEDLAVAKIEALDPETLAASGIASSGNGPDSSAKPRTGTRRSNST